MAQIIGYQVEIPFGTMGVVQLALETAAIAARADLDDAKDAKLQSCVDYYSGKIVKLEQASAAMASGRCLIRYPGDDRIAS